MPLPTESLFYSYFLSGNKYKKTSLGKMLGNFSFVSIYYHQHWFEDLHHVWSIEIKDDLGMLHSQYLRENNWTTCHHSCVYTSGHCRRWRSRMEVKIMAGSLFVHCKIAYFYSVTAEKWLIVSLPNFVTIRRTHLSISCKIFSWIRTTKLKIHAMEFCEFIKDSVSPSGLFVPCSLTVTSTWRPRLTAHCPIRERHQVGHWPLA